MSVNDTAKKFQDSGNESADELAKLLVTSSTALLIFWGAIGIFIMKDPEYTIHPKYIWVTLLSSIFCGIGYYMLRSYRYWSVSAAIVRGIPNSKVHFEMINGVPSVSSYAGWLETFLRISQPVTFVIALILSVIELA